jgi:hypothetical protein
LRVIFAEKHHVSLDEAPRQADFPGVLVRDDTERRLDHFPLVNTGSTPDSSGPCLEQIWYDIGFDLGKKEAYGPAIREGMDRAYEYLITVSGLHPMKRPAPPLGPRR